MELKEEFIEKLKSAKSIVFFTGAGISAESGIPTFRGKDGIWNKLKPEELANFNAFLRNPDMVWEWYQYRRQIIHDTKPNAGHFAMAEFEKYFDDVTVVTQNVDNLHRRAGSSNVFELHGNIERNYCIDCSEPYYIKSDEESLPKCKICGGLIRPDVVWFGEMLPQEAFAKSEKAAADSDICIIAGTSAVVYPAAYIPLTARDAGSYLVEINVAPTEISGLVNYSVRGKSGEVVPAILEAVKEMKK
ncbi:MAG: NAD-dependent deacylase [Ignavibacteriae bacterium]|nr:NAD-dependent deacylase [Ignavibacteriota bacterium]NOG98473.1 NAD-dependent deacylase [Ignavibacteriota bacterium]